MPAPRTTDRQGRTQDRTTKITFVGAQRRNATLRDGAKPRVAGVGKQQRSEQGKAADARKAQRVDRRGPDRTNKVGFVKAEQRRAAIRGGARPKVASVRKQERSEQGKAADARKAERVKQRGPDRTAKVTFVNAEQRRAAIRSGAKPKVASVGKQERSEQGKAADARKAERVKQRGPDGKPVDKTKRVTFVEAERQRAAARERVKREKARDKETPQQRKARQERERQGEQKQEQQRQEAQAAKPAEGKPKSIADAPGPPKAPEVKAPQPTPQQPPKATVAMVAPSGTATVMQSHDGGLTRAKLNNALAGVEGALALLS